MLNSVLRLMYKIEILSSCSQRLSIVYSLFVVLRPSQHVHVYSCHFTGLANATAILEESYQEYPSSAVFLFFKGLVSRLKVNFLMV